MFNKWLRRSRTKTLIKNFSHNYLVVAVLHTELMKTTSELDAMVIGDKFSCPTTLLPDDNSII